MSDPSDDDYFANRPSYVWVQQADIAADVFVADDELLVWVTDLLTGEPLEAPLEHSVLVVAILEAAARSAAKGGSTEIFDG